MTPKTGRFRNVYTRSLGEKFLLALAVLIAVYALVHMIGYPAYRIYLNQ